MQSCHYNGADNVLFHFLLYPLMILSITQFVLYILSSEFFSTFRRSGLSQVALNDPYANSIPQEFLGTVTEALTR